MDRKIISILLALTLISGLTACGGEEKTTETTSAENDTTTEAVTTSYIDSLPIVDYSGQEFTIIGQSYSGRQNFYIE